MLLNHIKKKDLGEGLFSIPYKVNRNNTNTEKEISSIKN